MKKLVALMLVFVMVFSLAACGGGGEASNDPPKETDAPKTTETPKQTDAPTEPEPKLTIHENTFFSVGYNEEDGWSLAEDDISIYDDGGSVTLKILDDNGNAEVSVLIYAMVKHVRVFREAMDTNNIDMQAYANGTVETVTIGGQTMLEAPRGSEGRFFFGHDEAPGLYYYISTYEYNDSRVPALIENITFAPVDVGKENPPWYWEGEPFSADTVSQEVAGYTVTAEFVPMSEPQTTFDTLNHSIEALGDNIYILTEIENKLRHYTLTDGALTLDKVLDMETAYSVVESANGALVMSRSPSDPVIVHDGETITKSYDGAAELFLAPDGTWGISTVTSGDKCEKVTFTDEGLHKESFPLNELKQVRYLNIDDKYIYAAGTPVDSNDHMVFVYDHSGELKMTLGPEPDGKFKLGSVTYVAKTANGFLGFDANYRNVVLWAEDGTWLGEIDGKVLFSASYPWMIDADILEDGSILVIMSQEREDLSAIEIVAFKITVS